MVSSPLRASVWRLRQTCDVPEARQEMVRRVDAACADHGPYRRTTYSARLHKFLLPTFWRS